MGPVLNRSFLIFVNVWNNNSCHHLSRAAPGKRSEYPHPLLSKALITTIIVIMVGSTTYYWTLYFLRAKRKFNQLLFFVWTALFCITRIHWKFIRYTVKPTEFQKSLITEFAWDLKLTRKQWSQKFKEILKFLILG